MEGVRRVRVVIGGCFRWGWAVGGGEWGGARREGEGWGGGLGEGGGRRTEAGGGLES